MNRYLSVFILLCLTLSISAQEYSITGKIMDKRNSIAIEMATIRLMKADSTFINGVSSSSTGVFKIKASKAGKYLLKISYIGYKPVFENVVLSAQKPSADLGTVMMTSTDVALKSATVAAKVPQLEMRQDTFVYNVAAYRVPEGSTLEALVDKFPGAVVSDDGTITINGKTVSQIRVDGKDFFRGDTKVAMKNLPVALIDKVKAYDMKSDYTKQTGIDDGNEQTVLDLSLKQKLKSTWFSNVDLAAGNKSRYSSKLFANRFTDNTRFTAFGSLNNVNDRGFRGGGPGFRGGGGGGLTASKMFGFDGFWNNGKKENEGGYIEFGGNANFGFSNSDALSRSNSETFLTSSSASSFGNSSSHNYSNSKNASVGLRVEWKPDTMTSFSFRPSYSHSTSNGNSGSFSTTFNSDPYAVNNTLNPLDSMFMDGPRYNNPLASPAALRAIAVNRNLRYSLSDNKNDNVNGEFNITRRLNRMGRSISFQGEASYSKSSGHSFSQSDIYYYQLTNRSSDLYQYSVSPSKSWSYSGRLSYSEPIVKNFFFQGSYDFQYRYSDQNRSLYELDSLGITGRDYPIGYLPTGDSLNLALNMQNSQYATYKDYVHTVNLGFRFVNTDFNLSAGVRLQPQHTKLFYQKNLLDTIVTRNVFNISPDVRLRYNISKFSRLEFRYRGSSSQPSMTDLLDVTDNSNPLMISKGNPGLKPSWTNNMNLYYNNYISDHQRNIAVNMSYSQTSNSISNAMTYDETTGVRTTRPENINGNWDTNAFVMFTTAFGPDNSFNLNTGSSARYAHSVGYVSTGRSSSQKNAMNTTDLSERLRTSYRSDLFEIGLNGNINYSHSRSSLQTQSNMDTYTFAYGGNVQFNFDWNMSLSSDIAMNSRRGYTDASMNTNELLWNAQISQSFLSQNAATLSVQFYDILHRQSNISRMINAQMRQDSWSNSINSYFLIHFIYRLNMFGGSQGRIRFGRSGDRDSDSQGGEGRRGGGMMLIGGGGGMGPR